MIDVPLLRSDTPGVRKVAHFNNAGAALMPTPVIDAVEDYRQEEILYGGYETHRKRGNQIAAVYSSIADLIGSERSEVALADNATRAWDMLFYSLGLTEGSRIITTTSEYVSNWAAYLQVRDRLGVVVDVAPDTSSGEIDVEALEAMVTEADTALITMNHMPTNGGLVNPAADVGDVASRHGVRYLLDACQTIGQMPIDVNEIKCDMLTATSRKYLRGPRGVGFLYITDELAESLDPVFVETESAPVVLPDRFDLAAGAHRFETWEKAYDNVVGLGAAIDYATDIGIEAIWDRIRVMSTSMRNVLEEIEGVTVHDLGSVKGGIVSFTIEGRQTLEIRELLSEQRINVSTSTAFSAPVDMHARDLEGVVRASVHAYNSDEEVDRFIDAIRVMA
ncbi:MAG: aminotransferase class V-fold PLP-dependent enzyme [Actinomycetia bacterium]|nr:aminotransferase class V-fold PLP-dependent enzyme [Actinomycetes bacterium]